MIRTYNYPLKPTKVQEATLDLYLWRCRELYNCVLEEKISAWKTQRRNVTRFNQFKALTEIRRTDPVYKSVPSDVLRSALVRLHKGFDNFLENKAEEAGFHAIGVDPKNTTQLAVNYLP